MICSFFSVRVLHNIYICVGSYAYVHVVEYKGTCNCLLNVNGGGGSL